MINWSSITFFINLFLIVEIVILVIYLSFLLIKALKMYIWKNNDKNSAENTKVTDRKSKAGVIGIAVFNIVLVVFLLVMPYIQRINEIYDQENVIICDQNEVDKFTKLLDDNKIEYKIIDSRKVKMQNRKDFEDAERIVRENCISYSAVSVAD